MAHYLLLVRILPLLTSILHIQGHVHIYERDNLVSLILDVEMSWQSLLHSTLGPLSGLVQQSLFSFLCCLVIVGDAELSFSFPVPLETQPSFLAGEQAPAERKSFHVHTHTAIYQHGWLPMVFSSCKEFIFPG